jgi:hypothetical protein
MAERTGVLPPFGELRGVLFRRSCSAKPICVSPSGMLDTADLTVLVGLVRRAKVNAERRQERRQRLGKVNPGRDPGRTKLNKLTQLQAKLQELQSRVQ